MVINIDIGNMVLWKRKKKKDKLDRAVGTLEGGREMERRESIGKGWMAEGTGRLGFLF